MKRILYFQTLSILKIATVCFLLNALYANSSDDPLNNTQSNEYESASKTFVVKIKPPSEYDSNDDPTFPECDTKYASYKTCVFIVNSSNHSLTVLIDEKNKQLFSGNLTSYLLNEDVEIKTYTLKVTTDEYPFDLFDGEIKNRDGLDCGEVSCKNW